MASPRRPAAVSLAKIYLPKLGQAVATHRYLSISNQRKAMTRSREFLAISLSILGTTAGCTEDPLYETDASAILRPMDPATPVHLRVSGAVNISSSYPAQTDNRSINIDQLQLRGLGWEAVFLRVYDATSCGGSLPETAIFDPDQGKAATKAGDYGLIVNIQGNNYFWLDRQKSPDGFDRYFDYLPLNASIDPKSDRYLGDKIVVVQSADRKNGALEPGAWRSCGVIKLE
jgi:hypothetical protein